MTETKIIEWFKTEDKKPKVGFEVLGYNKEWIDEDFNPDGICVCFLDDEGGWFIAKWCGYHDEWHAKYTLYTKEDLEKLNYQAINAPTDWSLKPYSPK